MCKTNIEIVDNYVCVVYLVFLRPELFCCCSYDTMAKSITIRDSEFR